MNKVRVLKKNEKVDRQKIIVLNIENKYEIAFELNRDLICQKILNNFMSNFKKSKLINFKEFLEKYAYELNWVITENITNSLMILFNIYDNTKLSIYKIVDNINEMEKDIETFSVLIRNREIMIEMLNLYKEYIEEL